MNKETEKKLQELQARQSEKQRIIEEASLDLEKTQKQALDLYGVDFYEKDLQALQDAVTQTDAKIVTLKAGIYEAKMARDKAQTKLREFKNRFGYGRVTHGIHGKTLISRENGSLSIARSDIKENDPFTVGVEDPHRTLKIRKHFLSLGLSNGTVAGMLQQVVKSL